MTLSKDIKKAEKKFRKTPNVVGVGFGKKYKNGKETRRNAIHIFVQKKISKQELSNTDVIPKQFRNIPTDVIEIGEVKAHSVSHKSKRRPVLNGISGGHYHITAGTIGALVYQDGIYLRGKFIPLEGRMASFKRLLPESMIVKEHFWLTNAHVGADENKGKIGDFFLQPGPMDGGTARSAIGTLYKTIKLKNNVSVDGCLIKPLSTIDFSTEQLESFKKLGEQKRPAIGMEVVKSGRTTKFTEGTIMSTHATINVAYETDTFRIKDCVIMTYMSAGGDSGSLVTTKEGRPVSLIFAGSNTNSIGNDIRKVCEHLQCHIVTDEI